MNRRDSILRCSEPIEKESTNKMQREKKVQPRHNQFMFQ